MDTYCTCDAGYTGRNHSIFCALVREPEPEADEESEGVLDYPRAAIPEAIALGLE